MMRWRSVVGLCLASALLFATSGPSSRAQFFDLQQRYNQPYGGGYGSGYQQPQPSRQRSTTRYYDPRTGRPYDARSARPSYDPRPQPAPSSGGFFGGFFGGSQEVVRQPAYSRPREARRYYDPPPRKARRLTPAAPKPDKADKPEAAEVEPSTHIVVFGDSLAELVQQGLDTAFEDAEDIGVDGKTRGDSGLVRTDVYDWPKAIQEYLNGSPKITFAVVMLGANDRQAIREGENAYEPLSERWKEIYRARIDDVLKPFAEKRIPLIWIGNPPVRNEKMSADLLAINDVIRERVQKGGAVYVDIWQGFVDDQNRYSPVGPDVEGQVVRLRTSDGIAFTKAGARKVAHFADVELKRLIEARGGSAVAGSTPEGQAAAASKEGDVDRLISASLPALPEPQGLPSLPTKPIAGPVLPLTRAETSPGGTLVSGRPRLDGDAYLAGKAFREGIVPPPKPGRADDFKWPRS